MSSINNRSSQFQPGRNQPRPSQAGSTGTQGLNDEEKKWLEQIICQGDVQRIVKWADKLGQKMVEGGLSTSQIRNVYGTVKTIQLSWKQDPQQAYRDAVLLIPKLHYQVARNEKKSGSQGLKEFERVMVPALELLAEGKDEEERFQRFTHLTEFFEAMLAYHKKYGGRD